MKLSEVITIETIKVPLKANDKVSAIKELVNLLCKANKVPNEESFLNAILEREAARTTGIGQGLAIPHGKFDGLDRLVMAVGKPEKPIDFQSIDNAPVNLIVLLASPTNQTGPHIQALARISRLMTMQPFRDKINEAKTAEDIYQAFVDHDN